MCRRDHLIAAADTTGLQREPKRIGALRDAETVRRATVGGELLLEEPHVLAKNKVAAREHRGHRRIHISMN